MSSFATRFCSGSNMTEPQLRHHLDPTRPVSDEEQAYRFNRAIYTLYWQAERVRQKGISHRNFCVGCAMYAFREDSCDYASRWTAVYGMNTTVLKGSRTTCAEAISLGAAYSSAYTKIIGMVIVGETQEDERGHIYPTLRPCAQCRLLMKNHPLIKSDTIIVTAVPPPREIETLDEVAYETHTFRELLEHYGEV